MYMSNHFCVWSDMMEDRGLRAYNIRQITIAHQYVTLPCTNCMWASAKLPIELHPLCIYIAHLQGLIVGINYDVSVTFLHM